LWQGRFAGAALRMDRGVLSIGKRSLDYYVPSSTFNAVTKEAYETGAKSRKRKSKTESQEKEMQEV